jgi:predicted O-methyltransferase YrrM
MTYPDWFSHTAKPNFEKHLLPLAGKNHYKCMQIGAFTGDASIWLARNVLTSDTAHLLDLDTWLGSKEEVHTAMDFSDVHNTYKEKIKPYPNTISWVLGDSFINLQSIYDSFDFIYIDGDHTTIGVLLDAELSWPKLKSGGILAFDDYTWGSNLLPHLTPKPAIDMFVDRHKDELEILDINDQYWVKKK